MNKQNTLFPAIIDADERRPTRKNNVILAFWSKKQDVDTLDTFADEHGLTRSQAARFVMHTFQKAYTNGFFDRIAHESLAKAATL
jgi:putative heme degradation protein